MPVSLIRWFSAARGKFTEIHRPIPSAFRDSSRAQQQWHRLILKITGVDIWMPQPSLGIPSSPNIPGTPSAVARRGPAKPLHTQMWREWAPGPGHTHIDTHYLGWGLHSHQDYKNKHNTIKMGISSSSLSPSHQFPAPTHVSYYFPETTKSICTTQDKIGKGNISQVNLQKYELFWCDLCYRGDNRVLGHRGSISLCCLLLSLLAVLPLDGTFQRWELQPYTPKLEWPTSPAAPKAAKLHCEERRNNPPAPSIALPETGWGKGFKSPFKLQTMLYLVFVGIYLIPISAPGGFLLSSTVIIYS